ncbi:MAG: DUF4886 domain-containing protein [Planctomycetes bacterium]|nr:DUF4886 domain-containing protein [Planctomycetota bacterium]
MKKLQLILLVLLQVAAGISSGCSTHEVVQRVDADGAPAIETPAQVEEPVRKLRVLGVGNSFTLNAVRYLPFLTKDLEGVQLDVGVAYIGGCSLRQHAAYAKYIEEDPNHPKALKYRYHYNFRMLKEGVTLKEMLLDGKWDYITIQQVSGESFDPKSYHPYAEELCAYIKKYAPGAKIVILETWAYRNDCPRLQQWDLTVEAMYAGLHAAYAQLGRELSAPIIPVGTAFEIAKQNPLWQYAPTEGIDPDKLVWPEELPDQGKSLHNGYSWREDRKEPGKMILWMDGYHANTAGEYLGALVWYEFFLGLDAREATFAPPSLNPEQAHSLREAAHAAMEKIRAGEEEESKAELELVGAPGE